MTHIPNHRIVLDIQQEGRRQKIKLTSVPDYVWRAAANPHTGKVADIMQHRYNATMMDIGHDYQWRSTVEGGILDISSSRLGGVGPTKLVLEWMGDRTGEVIP